jgi:protein-S-isoprenylcysteine O-methyltransferase Ste14
MRATDFEFRHRSLLNLVHFWLAFQVYLIDKINVIWAIAPWTTPRGKLLARLLFAAGMLFVGLAAGIRTWAAAYLRSRIVHDPSLHAERLVADGPYRYTRNPLYLGTFLLSLGVGFLASRLGFVLLVGGAALRILRLIGREEDLLGKSQGDPFRDYCARVPRLWPSLHARVTASGVEPRWGQAFFGEAPLWGFFVTMIAFTVTLRNNVAWGLGGATLLVWFFERISERLRRAP